MKLYGREWKCEDSAKARATIELICFAKNGPLGRYEHLKRAIDLSWNVQHPGTMIWNDWSELMLDTFCNNRWVTLTGSGACVAGDTRILDPTTGEEPTIAELHRRNVSPVVMTLHGPERAGVPFVKGESELLRIRLSDGSQFSATSEHLVLTPTGYERVGSLSTGSHLFGYEPILQATSSVGDQSTRVLDARGSPKRAEDSQSDCRHASRLCDEQLPLETDGARSLVPPRICVPEHKRLWQREFSHTLHESQSDRPSSSDSFRQLIPAGNHDPCRSFAGISVHNPLSYRSPSQFSSANSQIQPVQEPTPYYEDRHYSNDYHGSASYRLRSVTVSSISRAGKNVFYDITVPSAAHYFAEGAIHHNSWKTTCAAMYVLCAWYSSPKDTAVICTSTTLQGLRRRIWKEISKFYRLRPLGNLVQSRNCIEFTKGAEDAGIFGIATEEGQLKKALGKLIGFHAPKIIVVVDEMPYIPEAIIEACVNLESGAQNFQFIGLGNADDPLDPHGRMCEPKNGWDSVDVDSEQWETKRGICVHLDGLKSPNVLAGKNLYPGLLTQKDIDNTADFYGADSPQFWQMRRGFWAPEGVQKTVLNMPMIVKARAKEQITFDGEFVRGAGLDPAFEGGDRCTLRFAKCGKSNGKKVVLLGERVIIKPRVSKDEELHYQIVEQVKKECLDRDVSATYFALDSTGEGGGLQSIFQREWSRDVLGVEFGGRPSTRPISQTNSKRADQEYDRRVTELWFSFRLLVQMGQMYGLDEQSAMEFCRRWWEMKGAFISLETKRKMKERTRLSPDFADTDAVVAEMFRQRYGLLPDKTEIKSDGGETPWQRFLKKRNLVSQYDEEAA